MCMPRKRYLPKRTRQVGSIKTNEQNICETKNDLVTRPNQLDGFATKEVRQQKKKTKNMRLNTWWPPCCGINYFLAFFVFLECDEGSVFS